MLEWWREKEFGKTAENYKETEYDWNQQGHMRI